MTGQRLTLPAWAVQQGVNRRTAERWAARETDPLPVTRVTSRTTLVSLADGEKWLARQHRQHAGDTDELARLVDEVVADLCGGDSRDSETTT
jgi:hypothetical protein